VASYRKNMMVVFLFLLPAFLIYTALEVFPVIASIYFSFHEWPGIQSVPLKFVGLDNFAQLFSNEEFIRSLKNVGWYIFWSVITQIPIGFGLAILLNRATKGVRFFKASFFIPMVLPATSISFLWNFILFPNDMGVVNNILRTVGLGSLSRAWLVDETTALACIIIVTTWASVGYYMAIGMAAIAGIPEEVMESAKLDGAIGWKRVFYIMVPMMWESIKISVVLVITGVLKIFDIIFIMTNGGPNGATHVPATLMYNEAFKYNNYGLGSAISTVIFLLSITLALLSLKLMQRDKLEN
jgi:raffinose/stachyose/melibiose transport system permease protein